MQDIRRRESGRHNGKVYRETFAREHVVETEHACHGGTRSMRTSHRWILITEPCNFFDRIGVVHHRHNTFVLHIAFKLYVRFLKLSHSMAYPGCTRGPRTSG